MIAPVCAKNAEYLSCLRFWSCVCVYYLTLLKYRHLVPISQGLFSTFSYFICNPMCLRLLTTISNDGSCLQFIALYSVFGCTPIPDAIVLIGSLCCSKASCHALNAGDFFLRGVSINKETSCSSINRSQLHSWIVCV